MPAGRGIFSTLTALENLAIIRRGAAAETPDDVFRRFPRLAGAKHRLGRFLSGGEQQMLAIGRAIMTEPSLMLLDEPSQGLAWTSWIRSRPGGDGGGAGPSPRPPPPGST